MANTFAQGNDTYPKTIDKAITTIMTYKPIYHKPKAKDQQPTAGDKRVAEQFAQQGSPKKLRAGNNCYRCGRPNCVSFKCPYPEGYKGWTDQQKQQYEQISKGQCFAQVQDMEQEEEQDDTGNDSGHEETGDYHFGVKKPKHKSKGKRRK